MKKIYKVAIIGGGASGLFTAIELLNNSNFTNCEIVIIERLDRVGKKILSTGNGQCNITNKIITNNNYFGDKNFIDRFIHNLKNIDIENYLYNIGIPLFFDESLRGYPLSKQSNCIVDTIRTILKDKVDFIYNFKAENIVKNNETFEISSNSEKIYSKSVVLACGGASSKQYGTDGTSYSLATNFGHKLSKIYPSLVQLKTNTENIKSLIGIREDIKLSVLHNQNTIFSTIGDIIFTNYGVSGNAIFKSSSYIVDKKNIEISIDFLPNYNELQVEKMIEDRIKNINNLPKEEILSSLVNKKVGQQIVKISNDCSSKNLARLLKNFKLKVLGNMGFDNSQVTRGGIEVDSISNTFMSKLCENLYILGEMLNIDGECGGYNLTFAICSGIICAKNIKNETK